MPVPLSVKESTAVRPAGSAAPVATTANSAVPPSLTGEVPARMLSTKSSSSSTVQVNAWVAARVIAPLAAPLLKLA